MSFGTASAPVSRSNTRMTAANLNLQDINQGPDMSMTNDDDPSPPSSGRTAVHSRGVSGHNGADLRPPTHLTDNLGSASAPSSPGLEMRQDPLSLGGFAQNRLGQSISHDDLSTGVHPDPAVAAGLLAPSASEGILPAPQSLQPSSENPSTLTVDDNGVRRRDHHHHRHHHRGAGTGSGHNTPAFDPNFYYSQRPWDRPVSHQNAKHSTPLYSLARPLPTKEQRDAQKAYRQNVRARAAGTSGQSTPHTHATIGPGGHHVVNAPFGTAPIMGPGGHHYGPSGSYYGQPGQYSRPASILAAPGLGGAHDKDQLLGLLRQLLNENDDKGKPDEKDGQHKKKDKKDVMEDKALARKEGFGNGDNAADDEEQRSQERTRRAERGSISSGSSGSSSSSSNDDDDVEGFPNPWARFRHTMREPFAEFWGTYILILFGTGVSLQYFLTTDPNVTSSPFGTYTSVSFGWAVGVALGVWVAGGVSGGHLNPAVTLSLAVFRGFPWRKLPGYMLAQLLGALAASGTTYGLYRGAIDIFEGGRAIRSVSGPTATANLFSTYPQAYVTDATAWFQEFVDTAILMIVVLAISDSNGAPPPDGLNPLVLFMVIFGLGACLGMQTAYCLNPARDLGPRLMTWMAGYGREVWNFRNQYWLWTPVIATFAGALFGSFCYDAFIYTGSESPLNRKWELPWSKKKRASFAPASKEKMPAGQTYA